MNEVGQREYGRTYLYTRGQKTRLGPTEKPLNPGQVHRPVPLGGGAGASGKGKQWEAGALLTAPAALPQAHRHQHRLHCSWGHAASPRARVCALRAPGLRARQPHLLVHAEPSHHGHQSPPQPCQVKPRPWPRRAALTPWAAGGLMGLAVSTAAAGPSQWLASVSTWCRMCPWLCTTSAGSLR